MARKARTDLGGKVDTRAMLQAGTAQKEVSEVERQRGMAAERTTERTVQAAGAADKAIQYDTERRSAETEAQRAEATRVQERQEGIAAGLPAEKRAQEQHEMDIYDRGLQRAAPGEAGAPGAPGEQPSAGEARAEQTAQEMERGAGQPAIQGPPTAEQTRRAEQGSRPLELPAARGGIQGSPFEQRPEVAAAEAYAGETERIKAEADRASAMTKYHEALYGTQNPQDRTDALKELQRPVEIANKRLQSLLDAQAGGTPLGSSGLRTGGTQAALQNIDWAELEKQWGDSADPNVAAAIQSKQVTPELIRMAANHVAKEGVEFAAYTGEYPGQGLVDDTNQLWRLVQDRLNEQNDFQRLIGATASSIADKQRQLLQAAAIRVYIEQIQMSSGGGGEQPQAEGGGPPGGSPGLLGSTGLNPRQPDPNQQPFSTPSQHPGYEGRELEGGRGQAVQRNVNPAVGLTSEPRAAKPPTLWEQIVKNAASGDWARDLPK